MGHILKNVFYLMYYRKSNFKVKFVYWIELHISTCYFVYFLGFLLLFYKLISTRYFLLFGIPYLMLSIVLFFYNAEDNFYLTQKKFAICEAIQLFIISLKFSQLSALNWNYTLIFFMAASIYLTLLGILLTIILSCSFFGFMYRNLEKWKIKALIWMTWYYIWSGLIYIYLIKGAIQFYNEDDIFDHNVIEDYITYKSNTKEIITITSYLFVTFSLSSLIMHLAWKKEIKKYLQKVIYRDELRREISLRFLSKNFSFPIVQISEFYFSKKAQKSKSEKSTLESPLDKTADSV